MTTTLFRPVNKKEGNYISDGPKVSDRRLKEIISNLQVLILQLEKIRLETPY